MELFNSKTNKQGNYLANTFLLKPMWFAAGADPYLLQRGTYSDQVKMACMGGTVYATALLAFISGSFAIQTIFFERDSSSLWIYVFGLVWAAIIFNLDRFIVSSTPPNIGKVWYKKILNALPRILMGLVISFVISKPLELKIFEKDINQVIAQSYDAEFAKLENSKLKGSKPFDNLSLEISNIDEDIQKVKIKIASDEVTYTEEIQGKGRGEGHRGVGHVANNIKNNINSAKNNLADLELAREALLSKKSNLQESLKQEALIEGKLLKEGMGSFVKQIGIAHTISPIISWALTILFVVLELTPIFFKLMMERAPYDFQLYDRDKVIVSRSTVYQDGLEFYSKNAQQIVTEKDREIENQDVLHSLRVEEVKRQGEAEISKQKDIFDSHLEDRMSKAAQMKKIEVDNQYNAFINSNINHEQEQLLLNNLESKQKYITRLDELEQLNLERNLVKTINDQKIVAHEHVESKRVEGMKISELDKLTLEEQYKKQLIEIDKEYNEKRLSIYKDLLNKRIAEETQKTEVEISANDNNKLNHALEMQSINSKVGNVRTSFNDTAVKDIQDDLIDGKYYNRGENYSEVKILTKETIMGINNYRDLTGNQVDVLYNSEDNKIITDSKIGQFKRGKNLLETVNAYKDKMNGEGLKLNIEKAKYLDKEARQVLAKANV